MKKMSKSICFFYALLLASFVMPHQVAAASVFYGLLYEAPNNLSKDTIKVYRLDIPADIRNIDNLSYLADQDVHLWNLDTDNAFGEGALPNGTEVMAFVSYEENPNTTSHKGYYAAAARNYDGSSGLNEYPVMTLVAIPIPAGIINGANVELTWSDITQTDNNVIGYNIFRSLSPDSGFIKINTNAIYTNSYTDINLDFSGGKQYYYTLQVIFRGGVTSTYYSANSAPLSDCDAIIAQKDQTISELNSTIASQNTTIANLNTSIGEKNTEINQLNNTINTLNATIMTKDTEIANLNNTINTLNATITAKNTEITNLNYTIATMFTQEQLNQEVATERARWDANSDNKKGLEEAIEALQVVAGIK